MLKLAFAAGAYLKKIGSSTGKKTPGGAGTHTGHTGHTGARGQTDHTDEPHMLTTIHPNPKTQTRTKTATDSTAARTAVSPESTAPRNRYTCFGYRAASIPVGSGGKAPRVNGILVLEVFWMSPYHATPLRDESFCFPETTDPLGDAVANCTPVREDHERQRVLVV